MIVLEFRFRKQAKQILLVIFERVKSSVKFTGFVVENYIGHRSIEMYERKMNLRNSIENESVVIAIKNETANRVCLECANDP